MTQTQQKTRIPDFKNSEELAKFWDTHDVTDYLDELEPVDVKFELEKPKDETMVIRFNKDIKAKITHIAKNKGLNPSSLVRMWVMEKLIHQNI